MSASAGKKPSQYTHIILVCPDADGIHLAAAEGILEPHRLLLPPASLRLADGTAACVDDLLLSCLSVMYLQQTDVGQLGHAPVIDLNGDNVVLMRRDGERLQEGMLVEEVAQHKGDAPSLDGSCQVLQSVGNVCPLALRFVVEEFANDVEDVLAAFLGRDELLYLVREEDDAYLVVVLDGRKGKCGGNLRHHVALELLDGTEVEAAADVNQQHDRQLSFLLEDLDIRLSETCRDVPLNVADVIAVLVLAHLGESHAAPFEGRVILARKDVAAQATRLNLDPPDLL